ncbi:MAG: putative metal-binding motif-containing protein, partial [Polyangiales bacterium]
TSCMVDTCNETAKTCTHTKITGTDVDGDGTLDLACGGTDCDDKDPRTFAGAAERCDGRDNSCNLKIDDYAVLPRGSALVSAPAGGKINGATAWMGDKMLAFSGVGGVCGVSKPANLYAQLVDATGTAGTEKVVASGACTGFIMLAAAGSPSHALVAWESASVRYATIVRDDASVVATVSLAGPPGGPVTTHQGSVDVAWMGSSWLVGFTRSVDGGGGAVTNYGKFGFVSTTGSIDIRNVPTDDGTGILGTPGVVKTGFNATNIATAWVDSTGPIKLAIHDLAGAKTAGPVTLPAGTPVALAGTSKGFVLLYAAGTGTRYAFVSSAGVLGVDALAGIAVPRGGHGTFDAARGEGAMAAESNDGVTLLYGRGDLADGLEHTTAFTPAAPSTLDSVSIDFVGGLLGVAHYSQADGKSRGYKVGCLP